MCIASNVNLLMNSLTSKKSENWAIRNFVLGLLPAIWLSKAENVNSPTLYHVNRSPHKAKYISLLPVCTFYPFISACVLVCPKNMS